MQLFFAGTMELEIMRNEGKAFERNDAKGGGRLFRDLERLFICQCPRTRGRQFCRTQELSSTALDHQQWRTQFPPRFSVMNSTSSSPPSETSTSSKYGGHFSSTT
ncbi:hypothetical protein SDJN03_16162, partial [Cucurbita argyrosperma subsp. sororia]